MTALAARIADVKQKAGAWRTAKSFAELSAATNAFEKAARPDLFLAMAARIEELEKALEPMVDALSKCVPGWEDDVWIDDNHAIDMGHLRTAARALNGNKP
jgi:hypothetical protein